ncbi:MAG: tetratricopeptide repeat protein [Chloroflexi bacterium]|nr:tetratricopeptide repeat protein [Chloroflexota bacterium]
MCATLKSRNGLTLTTNSPAAVDLYQEGLDLVLSQNYGPDAKLEAALEADEGFAMAHVVQAYVLHLQTNVPAARAAAEKAIELSAGCSREEQQIARIVHSFTHGKGTEAIRLVDEHLDEFPTDTLAMRVAQRLYMLGCFGAGVPDFPNHLMAMMRKVAPANGDDWAFLGQYAFAHHETNQPEKAMDLATRSLEGNPQNAVASHSVTHSYFEQGDAANGGRWLGDWLDGWDRRASYNTHLSWHLALFELAQGKYHQALDLYETHIRPGVQARNLANLQDAASLMWRLQIYSGEEPGKPWNEVRDVALPAAETPGPAFRDCHAALAFAGAGDAESTQKFVDRVKAQGEKGDDLSREMVLPIALGAAAFAAGDYDEAADLMGPTYPMLARIGGSHAQREVFEDTLLETYIRAGRYDEARTMLDERLSRRSSVRDTYWMGRLEAEAVQGNPDASRQLMAQARAAWADTADEAAAEMQRLAMAAD